MRRKPRRILAGVLIAFGGLLLWLAPEASEVTPFDMAGLFLLFAAVCIEVFGIYLEHKNTP